VESSLRCSKVLENRRSMLARHNLYVLLSIRCPGAAYRLESCGEEVVKWVAG
jgi:hypothetical protein